MKPDRNPKWLRFIRSLACCVCSKTWSIEAAHVGNGGMGQKAPDTDAVPLCKACHRSGPSSLHKLGRRGFERVHSIDLQNVIQQLTAKLVISIEGGQFVGRFEDGLEYMLGPATHENRLTALERARRLRIEDLRSWRRAS